MRLAIDDLVSPSKISIKKASNRFIQMNANTLKLFAVLAMIAQHCAILFIPQTTNLHMVMYLAGKITAPIMCFFIAEGYFHTSDLKKYSLRLLLGAIISHIPHALAFGFSIWEFWRATSVMWSLFLGLIALAVYMKKDLPVILRILIIGCCCVLSYPGNWNCIAVLWVLGFGVFRESNGKKWAAFIGVTVLYILEFFVIESDGGFYFWSRFFVLVVIPLLSMYRGELGRKSKVLQWSYYLIYPVHFVALYMIQLLIG